MPIQLPPRETLTEPLYLSLASAIEKAILTGRIARGERLPTHRAVAAQLGLSIHTVSKAFDRLRQQNLIGAQVGRGTFVVDPEAGSDPPYAVRPPEDGLLDLAISRPLFDPRHDRLMRQALRDRAALADSSVFLSSRPNLGQTAHRQAGSTWLEWCGVPATPDRVAVTNGAAHGLALALSAATRPGDVVLADRITHHTIVSLCAYFGLRLIPVDGDSDGMLPRSLAAACAQEGARAVVTLPTLSGPVPRIMPEDRRRALAEVLRRHDLTVIENDAHAPLALDPPLPFAALMPDRVIHLSTFTKAVMPGLRTGYLVAPLKLRPAILARMIALSWSATPLLADIAAAWVEDGTASALANWQRGALAGRHAVLAEAFAGCDWVGHPSALHAWLTLPGGWRCADFVAEARLLDIDVAPGPNFLANPSDRVDAVRISTGGVPDDPAFRSAANLLAELAKMPR
ncbi:transcriptional regulator, GntR family protein [Pseudooceanicola batsensis HTCC2597]|uniref:Transcriptional regulator, GntR family protein n=1 Tax=Pseudooceanicola batsensis (strain ATCC BAA-863 / DSM 15984 / KCTC 12145 / HTCC2597) TaxID=252305 RepID=A3TYL3_PSEBH|nr:PLP-dependent aminotransferase family protein [Pseudooceanicola batsensis]EAQ03247.1 transcriptional regulator, GntR family protein [Pseudooceanicola batsensis HTCC2597]